MNKSRDANERMLTEDFPPPEIQAQDERRGRFPGAAAASGEQREVQQVRAFIKIRLGRVLSTFPTSQY